MVLTLKLNGQLLNGQNNCGLMAYYLDYKYISRSSCRPTSVLKGLRLGVGIQLRRNFSTEVGFNKVMEEKLHQFACSGWNIDSTRNKLLIFI